jgi:hypothetical protein
VQRVGERQIIDEAAVTGEQSMIFETHGCPITALIGTARV